MATPATTATKSASLERAAVEAFPFLLDALGISALGLLVPTSVSLGARFGGQLVLLVIFGLYLTIRLLPMTDTLWFAGTGLKDSHRILATGVATVFIVTGVVGLVTLASSAALRLQPSTQFLQLLSALDIAWSVSTVMVAAYWLWRKTAAIVAGGLVALVCLWSIAAYLDAVGFTPRGRWRLRASDLWEHVLPYDMVVAVIAIGLFAYAVRRRSRSLSE